jgi:hypothetical protein
MGFRSIREFGDTVAAPAHASRKNVSWTQGSIAMGAIAESGDRSDETAESASEFGDGSQSAGRSSPTELPGQ